MIQKIALLCCFAIVGFSIASCSGSSRNLGGGGRYCNLRSFEGFGTVPGDATEIATYSQEKNKGTIEDIITSQNLPVGSYELHVADFLYIKKVEPGDDPSSRRRWVMTQLREEVDVPLTENKNDGETYYKSGRYCAGGYRIGDKSYEISMAGIREFTVGEDNKIILDETTVWGYRWDETKLLISPIFTDIDPVTGTEKESWSKPEEDGKYQAPKDVYGEQVTDMTLHKLANADNDFYQVYTKIDLDGGTTFLMLKITYKKLKE